MNVTGGSLGYNFQVTTVVLHWGEGEDGGSEHSVGGRHAALEVQVTRNIFPERVFRDILILPGSWLQRPAVQPPQHRRQVAQWGRCHLNFS